MDIAQRSVRSVSWLLVANACSLAIGVLRAVLLARWLPVPVFGTYALAGAVVSLTVVVPNFGLVGAFLHRAPETEDEDQAAAVHFTLKFIFTAIWATLLTVAVLIFTTGETGNAILVLTATTAGLQLTQTPRAILIRRVVQRRLAVIQLANVILASTVAIFLASKGITLWALLATDMVTVLISIVGLYLWRPFWRPHFLWAPKIMLYFLKFGSRNFLSVLLLQVLNRIDKLWIGLYLGKTPLGFYSRAQRFATYPNGLFSSPVISVMSGTYAELKGNYESLSQAFFRTNALLIRFGFLMGGVLALVAPELVGLVLGEKWMPMLNVFRLMLIAMLLNPIILSASNLFVAVGRPGQVVKAQFIQLLALAAGILLLGPAFGIMGVAIAMCIMLAVGTGILLRRARAYVRFSPVRIFAVPVLALVIGSTFSLAAIFLPGIHGYYWPTFFAKITIFTVSYGTILFVSERNQIMNMVRILGNRLFYQSK